MIVLPFRLNMKKRQTNGFTIVELLIVIVVIAILAAISVVAYNGIQTRARNAQTGAAGNAYLKGFALYLAANNSYPAVSTYHCLGQTSCRGGTWSNSSSLDTALRTVMGNSLPAPSSTSVNDNSNGSVAMGYVPQSANVTLDGVARHWLIYAVEGLVPCPAGKVASGNWPSYSSATPSNGYTNANHGTAGCMVALPNP